MTDAPLLREEPSRAPRGRVAAAILLVYLAGGALLAILALRLLFAPGAEKLLVVGSRLGFWRSAVAASLALLVSAIVSRLGRTARGIGGGGLARAVFLHAASGWVLCLLFLQPYRRASFLAGAAIWFGVFALLSMLDAARPGWKSAKPVRALDLAATNLCGALLLLEIALRAFAFLSPSPLLAQIDRGVERYLERARFAPGQFRFGFPTNSRGYYDEEFRPRVGGEKRVAVISDSFGAGIVPHHFHFTTVCERALGGVPVDNYGVVHARPTEYLYILRYEVEPSAPDVVVVGIFVGNDVHETPPERRHDAILRGIFDRENALAYLVPSRLLRLSSERRKNPESELALTGAQGEDLLGTRRVESTVELKASFPWLVDPSREEPPISESEFLRHEGEIAAAICGPDLAPYDRFYPVMTKIRAAAGGIPIVVLLIPDELQVNDRLWDAITRGAAGPLDRDQPQRLLLEHFRRSGLPVLDLLPILRGVPPLEDGYAHCYHLCDTHLNARGNRVVGDALARFLQPYLE